MVLHCREFFMHEVDIKWMTLRVPIATMISSVNYTPRTSTGVEESVISELSSHWYPSWLWNRKVHLVHFPSTCSTVNQEFLRKFYQRLRSEPNNFPPATTSCTPASSASRHTYTYVCVMCDLWVGPFRASEQPRVKLPGTTSVKNVKPRNLSVKKVWS